jgi:hypothetical protein
MDLAHAARTERRDDLVRAEARGWGEGHTPRIIRAGRRRERDYSSKTPQGLLSAVEPVEIPFATFQE